MSIVIGSGITLGAGISALQEIPENYLWAWGNNGAGQLGLGDTVKRSSPVQVGALGTWSQVGGTRRGNFINAVDTAGKLWAWGVNSSGQLGLGNTTSYSSPKQVGALTNWGNSLMPNGGTENAVMVKSNGTAWIWGYTVGTPAYTSRSSPVQVGSDKTWAFSTATRSKGWFGITTGGELWSSVGSNSHGTSGQNNTTNTSSPAQVGALTDWAGVYPLYQGIIARKTDGTIWSWGYAANFPDRAALGRSNSTNSSSPIQIGALTNWAKISGDNQTTTHAIKTDGTLWAWGSNDSGQIGNGNAVRQYSPIQIGVLTNWLSTPDKLASGLVTLAIKSDGTLWAWGRAYFGAQGQNNILYKSSPVQVGTLTTWTKVTNNYNASFAIATHAT